MSGQKPRFRRRMAPASTGAVRVHLAGNAKWLVDARDRKEDYARVAVATSIGLVWLGGRAILSVGSLDANLTLGCIFAALGVVLSLAVVYYSKLLRLQVPAFVLGVVGSLLIGATLI